MSKRLGVLLVFQAGVDKALAQAAVDKLVREQLVDASRFSADVQTFDPDKEGSPVWYIP